MIATEPEGADHALKLRNIGNHLREKALDLFAAERVTISLGNHIEAKPSHSRFIDTAFLALEGRENAPLIAKTGRAGMSIVIDVRSGNGGGSTMHMIARPTDWDVQAEFIPLLQSHNLTDAQIHATVLPGRTIGAIQTLRAAICDWHQTDNFASTALNRVCRAYLAQQSRPRYTCPNHPNVRL